MREGNSPSWFNTGEVVQVMRYLQAIVANEKHAISHDDIGIITPYRKQVFVIFIPMRCDCVEPRPFLAQTSCFDHYKECERLS